MSWVADLIGYSPDVHGRDCLKFVSSFQRKRRFARISSFGNRPTTFTQIYLTSCVFSPFKWSKLLQCNCFFLIPNVCRALSYCRNFSLLLFLEKIVRPIFPAQPIFTGSLRRSQRHALVRLSLCSSSFLDQNRKLLAINFFCKQAYNHNLMRGVSLFLKCSSHFSRSYTDRPKLYYDRVITVQAIAYFFYSFQRLYLARTCPFLYFLISVDVCGSIETIYIYLEGMYVYLVGVHIMYVERFFPVKTTTGPTNQQ